jgi:hypothetical protein
MEIPMQTQAVQRLINAILKDLEFEHENLGLMRYLKNRAVRDVAAELSRICQLDLSKEKPDWGVYEQASRALGKPEHEDSTARALHQLALVLNLQLQDSMVQMGVVLVSALDLVVTTIVQCEANEARSQLEDQGLAENDVAPKVEEVELRARAKAATAVMQALALVVTEG